MPDQILQETAVTEAAVENIWGDRPVQRPEPVAVPEPTETAPPPTAEPAVVVTEPASTQVPEVDFSKYVKENFGFDSVEQAKEAVEKWRKSEAEPKPQTEAQKIAFANEESEKVFNLLKEGKAQDALKVYQKQQEIENATTLNPLDQIRLQLKYKNEKYTREDIEDIIEERYSIPKKPDEDDLDYDEKIKVYEKEAAKVERRIKRDGLEAVEQLQQHKKDLVLPDINSNAVDYQNFLKQQKELQDEEDKVRESYKTALAKDYSNFKGVTSTYKDKDVEIQVDYKPTDKELKDLKSKFENGFDADEYFAKRWFQEKDGKVVGFNIAQQMEDIYFLENKQAILDKINSDAANKRLDAFIKGEKRVSFKEDGSPEIDTSLNKAQKQDEQLTNNLWK